MFLPACQKMDGFDDEGMLESFTGMMRVTPGLDEEIMSETVTTGLVTYNSDGENIIIADASGKPFSLREMLLKDASDDVKQDFKDFLPLIDIHPDDTLSFSGFRAKLVEGSDGKKVKVHSFESNSRGLDELNVQVDGMAMLDKKNKMYTTLRIDIYMILGDLRDKFPEFLEFFTIGEQDTPLDEIEDDNTKILIAALILEGVAVTGLL